MNREIKFRGICKLTNDFVYGDLIHNTVNAYGEKIKIGIVPDGCYPVEIIKGTESQYTGLKDKKGLEIYEGDIVYYDDYDDTFLVYWCDVYCSYRLKRKNDISINSRHDYMYKVIGNIYENPQLLEGKDEEPIK